MADGKKFALRLSPDLYKAIEQRSKKRFRSVNSEIQVLLMMGLVCDLEEDQALNQAKEYLSKAPTN